MAHEALSLQRRGRTPRRLGRMRLSCWPTPRTSGAEVRRVLFADRLELPRRGAHEQPQFRPDHPGAGGVYGGAIVELLTGYGPLCEIWFDMSRPTLAKSRKFANLVHALQPNCMVSGRIFNGQEDFFVCSDNETPNDWFCGPWESPVSVYHDTWGYRSWQAHKQLPAKIREKVRDLAFVAARGGNYLLNIGPKGDGSIGESRSSFCCRASVVGCTEWRGDFPAAQARAVAATRFRLCRVAARPDIPVRSKPARRRRPARAGMGGGDPSGVGSLAARPEVGLRVPHRHCRNHASQGEAGPEPDGGGRGFPTATTLSRAWQSWTTASR